MKMSEGGLLGQDTVQWDEYQRGIIEEGVKEE